MKGGVIPSEKRAEWLSVGKMIAAGTENLLSLDVRLRNGILDQVHFEACLTQHHWINLTTLSQANQVTCDEIAPLDSYTTRGRCRMLSLTTKGALDLSHQYAPTDGERPRLLRGGTAYP